MRSQGPINSLNKNKLADALEGWTIMNLFAVIELHYYEDLNIICTFDAFECNRSETLVNSDM
jgi:hypothetical protein